MFSGLLCQDIDSTATGRIVSSGWAEEVHGREEEIRGIDAARHRQEKREATRLGKLLSQPEA